MAKSSLNIGLGVVPGVIIGMTLDNIAMGIGIAPGIAIGLASRKSPDRE